MLNKLNFAWFVATFFVLLAVGVFSTTAIEAGPPYPVAFGPTFEGQDTNFAADFERGKVTIVVQEEDGRCPVGSLQHVSDHTGQEEWLLDQRYRPATSEALVEFDLADRSSLMVGVIETPENGLDVVRVDWRGVEILAGGPGDQRLARIVSLESWNSQEWEPWKLISYWDNGFIHLLTPQDELEFRVMELPTAPTDATLACFPAQDGYALCFLGLGYHQTDSRYSDLDLYEIFVYADGSIERRHVTGFFLWGSNLRSLDSALEIWDEGELNLYGQRIFISAVVGKYPNAELMLYEIRQDWRATGTIEPGLSDEFTSIPGLNPFLTETATVRIGHDGWRTDRQSAYPNYRGLIGTVCDGGMCTTFRVITIQPSVLSR